MNAEERRLAVLRAIVADFVATSEPVGSKAIVDRLAKASSDAIDTPSVIERYKNIGVVVTAKDRRSPEYLTSYVKSEIARWAGPIKASGVMLD